ncbi:MAG: Lon protease family protein [Halanaerobiaceae bacterium]
MEEKNLKPEDLCYNCEVESFNFSSTDEISPFDEGIIGQNRAVKAVDLGMRVEQQGYNIFMSGMTGTGRTTYARTVAEREAEKYECPRDLCYVFNFRNPEKPRALELPAGTGIHLKADMDNFIADLKDEIPQVFAGEEYEDKKNKIMNDYQQESNELMEDFEQRIRKRGFVLKNTTQGPIPVPLDSEGEPIKQDEFQKMEEKKRKQIREESQEIQKELEQVMKKIRQLKAEAQRELKKQEKKIALSVIKPIIASLESKYEDCSQIIDFLKQVQEDIIEHLDRFKKSEDNQSQQLPIPFMQGSRDDENFFTRYQVNLLVDNQETKGAPVIYESNPTYYNLFGKIEGESKFGTVTTDFTMIKEGAVHKANGGYLILNARDVLTKPFSWETLKRTLINQEIVVENIGEQYRTIPIKSLKPEPVAIDVKVIMIGNPLLYQLLYNYDEEFKKLFKIRADFDVEMERTPANMEKFASFVACISEREGIRHFTAGAVGRVIEFSSRLTGSRDKMSTRFNELIEVLYEADAWAGMDNAEYVGYEHVARAIEEKEERLRQPEEKIQEMIEKEHILVDLEGESVGQINGLSVYQTGQYSFGRPSRITARTYLGQEGVINIEREVDMSGKIHNKGVMILSGFLGGKYAQDRPLTLSASLAFEQNYGGIDGDSASCAELIALLSDLADIPVNQGMALTGSMNQKGEVQPIGGVNEKIEGFYKVCKLKGLAGKQGVIIPRQNVENLMLKSEVIDAVKEGDFRIYPVETVNQIIELMMDKPAEIVHTRVGKALEEFAKMAAKYSNNEKEIDNN